MLLKLFCPKVIRQYYPRVLLSTSYSARKLSYLFPSQICLKCMPSHFFVIKKNKSPLTIVKSPCLFKNSCFNRLSTRAPNTVCTKPSFPRFRRHRADRFSRHTNAKSLRRFSWPAPSHIPSSFLNFHTHRTKHTRH